MTNLSCLFLNSYVHTFSSLDVHIYTLDNITSYGFLNVISYDLANYYTRANNLFEVCNTSNYLSTNNMIFRLLGEMTVLVHKAITVMNDVSNNYTRFVYMAISDIDGI